jgi:hypothetical protein
LFTEEKVNEAVGTIGDERDLAEFLRRHPRVILVCWLRECDMSRWVLEAVEEFARESGGAIAAAGLEVEENRGTCEVLEIHETPTLLFFHRGHLFMREVVALPVESHPALRREVEAAKETWRNYFRGHMPARAVA